MDEAKLIEATRQHFEAVKKKKIGQILDYYAQSENLLVFVEGPRWATLDFENVAKGWHDFCDSAINVKNCIWTESLQAKVVGKMGFVAGITELELEINGAQKTIRFRGTFILQEDADGKWRVVHEHFSQPAENPYGIGDWLKKD